MRALVVNKEGDLSLDEIPDPVAGPGEVLVDVRASALNRADLLQAKGLYPPPPGESEVPGLECAGVVAGLGQGVEAIAVGDRVMALLAGGGHGELVSVPVGQLMPVPPGMELTEAAGLPEVALTSWTNLVIEGALARGQVLLITAAASGVGSFAVQLARELGARVVVAGRSRERLEALRALGADAVCLLGDSLPDCVRENSEGRGADLVLELVGGDSMAHSLDALRDQGRLVLVGLMAGRTLELDLGLVMRRRLRILGSVLRSRSREEKAGLVQGFWDFAEPRVADGRLRPVIDRVLPFESLPEAYRQFEAGGVLGKVVVERRP